MKKTVGPGATAAEWIKDFVNSDDPRFAGKSKEERIRMALGAYYANKSASGFVKAEVAKVDEELGLVFGFAIVSKVDGEPYFDVQGDHIPEDAMLRAATDFMLHSRVAKEMHDGEQVGDVVFAFPLTAEVAKAMEIETRKTGLMIAMRPGPDVMAKYKDGTYRGFSIGGSRVKDEDV